MKRVKVIALIMVLIALPGLMFASGTRQTAPANRLEIFSWWTAGGEAQGLEALLQIFRSQNPNCQVVNSTVAGGAGTNAKAVLATRMQGGDPPDSFQVHAGHELIDSWVAAGRMESLNFLFEQNGWMNAYPRGVLDIISRNGQIYSVPVNIHRSNVLWYNKSVFTRLGLTPPTTIDEMLNVCRQLAAAGITPLALGDNGIWAATHLFESCLLAALGPAGYRGLWTGGTAWDVPGVRQACTYFTQLIQAVNTDHAALSWDQAAQYVIDGSAGMTIMGDWAEGFFKSRGLTPGVEFGWVPSPGTGGSFLMLSDSFGLPVGSPHRDNAIRWLTVCGSREGQDAFNPLKGSIPARTDADRALYDPYLQSAMDDFRTNEIVPSLAHGAAASEGWLTRFNDAMTLFVTDHNIDNAIRAFSAAAAENLR